MAVDSSLTEPGKSLYPEETARTISEHTTPHLEILSTMKHKAIPQAPGSTDCGSGPIETPPFGNTKYTLPACSLVSLGPDHAETLSRELPALDPWRHLGSTSEGVLRYLTTAQPGDHRFAMEVGGETVGVLCIRFPWLLGPFLELIAVLPPFQGKGLGGTVLRWLETEARRVSRNLWVTVSESNGAARRFYERWGFVEVGLLEDLVREGFTEILLRKRLK